MTYSRWLYYRRLLWQLPSFTCQTQTLVPSGSASVGCKHFTTSQRNHVKKWRENLNEFDNLSLDEAEEKLQQDISELERGTHERRMRKRGKSSTASQLHVPVMLDEVLQCFKGRNNETILDMTFGAGGHSGALLDQFPGCHIIGLDRDPEAHQIAKQLADKRSGQITPILGRFTDLSTLLSQCGITPGTLDGALLDLGSSSMQFDQSERGFSINKDAPLDMRMDGDRFADQPTAADVVNNLDEMDLAKIFKKYGEETRAKKIAHGIVEARSAFGRISTTHQLADVVTSVCESGHGYDKLGRHSHSATKTFQALRIFVNNEMNELNIGLQLVAKYLRVGGVCVVISFHSLEDRIVKRHFHHINLEQGTSLTLQQKRKLRSATTVYTLEEMDSMTRKVWEPLGRKVRVPSEEEVEKNPRSRSAKLRAAVKRSETCD